MRTAIEILIIMLGTIQVLSYIVLNKPCTQPWVGTFLLIFGLGVTAILIVAGGS